MCPAAAAQDQFGAQCASTVPTQHVSGLSDLTQATVQEPCTPVQSAMVDALEHPGGCSCTLKLAGADAPAVLACLMHAVLTRNRAGK